MKKNLLLIIILNSFFILGFSSNLFAKKAAIVIDFDTEEVLFEVNADTRNYPASLTKIMTLYIVFDYINKGKLTYDSQLSVSNIAASRSPSKLYLEAGSNIKVKDASNFDDTILRSISEIAEKQIGKMGRVLIRKSGTEEVIRVMVESEDEVLMLKLVDDINSKLLECEAK